MRGPVVNDMCICLENFEKLSKIVSLVLIDKYEVSKVILPAESTITAESEPIEIANGVINTYEFHAKKLYEHGRRSVLTRTDVEDHETLYFHSISRYYVPKLMKRLYEKHYLGI